MRTSGRRRSPAAASRRVALYLGQRGHIGQLREYAARQGWLVVAEFRAAKPPADGFQSLLDEATSGRLAVDIVIVPSLNDAFATAAQSAAALQRLHELGIDFRSYADPFLDTTRYPGGELARLAAAFALLDPGARPGGRAGADGLLADLAPGLGAPLRQLLELQIDSLTRQQREAQLSERRTRMRAPIGQLLTFGLIVAGYAAGLAAASSRSPLIAVINGDRIVAGISAGAAGSVNSLVQVPEPVRAALFTVLWSGALFVVRSFPLSSRLGVAGVVFAGLVNLVVLALASAAGVWFLGTVGATIGMLALVYVVYDFCSMVVTIEALSDEPDRAPSRRLGAVAWLDAAIQRGERFFARIHPARRPLAAALFIGLPVVSVAGLLAAVTWPGLRTGFLALGFLVWAAWGVGVTRPSLRLPLWSMLGWILVFLFFLSSAVDVSTYYLVLALVLLLVTTTIAIFRWPEADAPAAAISPG